jgi:hypothetical protein
VRLSSLETEIGGAAEKRMLVFSKKGCDFLDRGRLVEFHRAATGRFHESRPLLAEILREMRRGKWMMSKDLLVNPDI